MLHPTIEHNITLLLRAGAFGIIDRELETMSTFKWQKLEDIAMRLNVIGYIVHGAQLLKDNPFIPQFLIREEMEENYSASNARFFNRFKQKRYEHICDEEPHDISPSLDTLRLLKLIVSINDDIVTSQLPLPGIIRLGRTLRNVGDKFDYVKLENWINRLGIKQSAALQACLLIELFDFEEDEFPYTKERYGNAIKHYEKLIHNALDNETDFSSISRMNVDMVETVSYHLGNFTDRITDIEE